MDAPVLVLVEWDGGALSAGSLDALTLGYDVAAHTGASIEALTFGEIDEPVAAPGVSRLHTVRHEMLADYSPELWGVALAQVIGRVQPVTVIGSGSDRHVEVMAQAAARTGLPLATHCTTLVPADPEVAHDGDVRTWQLTRLRVDGLVHEDAELTAQTAMVTAAAGAVAPVSADAVGSAAGDSSSDVELVPFEPDLDGVPHTRLVERAGHEAGVTLATARVVVSGGRGVGSAEGFAPLEELAKLVGGAVGCSRVATSNGWRPHSDQVGQTGTKISPELYIACGISGATQHWVGCMNAKAILAINTDSDAPLVTRATYAVIGDVGEVVPAIVEEIHRRSGQ